MYTFRTFILHHSCDGTLIRPHPKQKYWSMEFSENFYEMLSEFFFFFANILKKTFFCVFCFKKHYYGTDSKNLMFYLLLLKGFCVIKQD